MAWAWAKKLGSISLGQGQGPIAERMITEAIQKGTWVLLQNCHLCVSWMPDLERICEKITPETVSPQFRMWLTSMPSDKFPVTILQNGIKMTNEPPRGLRANLTQSYLSIDDDLFDGCTKPAEWKKMLFGLSFFHALVQERRKFGPLGWNIPYEFNMPDFRISVRQLRMFIDKYKEIPYDALVYLTGHCNYGGRVTDDWDRRTLISILSIFYTANIHKDSYKFSPSEHYFAPAQGDKASYLSYIKTLPVNETPEVFGLHDNANLTFARNETTNMLSTVVSLQPRTTGGSGKSADDVVGDSAKDILNKIPEPFDLGEVSKKYPIMYEESMNTVLQQELIRFNRLIKVVRSSLINLQKAVKGLVVMSGDLEQVMTSLFNGQVPEMWAKKAYPSLKPLSSWVSDLLERLKFFQDWIDNGAPNIFWISGFFFTQSFLTGVLQNYARKHKLPIDIISFDFDFQKGVPERAPPDGAYVRGTFMEGARWDPETMAINESLPRQLFVSMPVLHLSPMKTDEINTHRVTYSCPMYRTLARRGTLSTTGHSTNYVMQVQIPSKKAEHHWVLRGVALFCALAD
eukprot:Rmarinus@m.13207